jgi:hypothetical protein
MVLLELEMEDAGIFIDRQRRLMRTSLLWPCAHSGLPAVSLGT